MGPTTHTKALFIIVPGAACCQPGLQTLFCQPWRQRYCTRSDCEWDLTRDSYLQAHFGRWLEPLSYPTFWKVKAVLMRQARPEVRAPICMWM